VLHDHVAAARDPLRPAASGRLGEHSSFAPRYEGPEHVQRLVGRVALVKDVVYPVPPRELVELRKSARQKGRTVTGRAADDQADHFVFLSLAFEKRIVSLLKRK
jgi:hypothetical protein